MKAGFLFILTLMLAGKVISQQHIKIDNNRIVKRINNKYGVTDTSDKIIVPFIYDFIEYKNNRLIVQKEGFQGLLTIDNINVIPPDYKFILPRRHNRFILWGHNSLFGLSDLDGQKILPVKFKNIISTSNDEFYITENERSLDGVYNFNGENVLPEVYRIYTIDGDKIFAEKNSQPLIINLQSPSDVIFLDTDLNFVETKRHHTVGEKFLQIVKKENKYGVINSSNQPVVPILYDEVRSSDHWSHYIIKKDNKIGIIKVDGTIVKELVYDAIELRKEYVLLKRPNEKDDIYYYTW